MALRPYGGSSGQRGNSMPSGAGRPSRGGELDLFGGGGLFGGRDPFAEFGSLDPFRGGGVGGGGFGGIGSMMQRFDDMTRDMMSGGGLGGPGAMRGMGGGNGQYACQSFVMSSHMGPDGKMHTEKFSSSDIGNHEKKIRESQQMYSNSSTGKDKMALERQLGDRARKMVKERDRNTQEERSTEMFRGMDEGHSQAFDRDFGAMAQHLPPHPRFDGRMLQGMSGGRQALPGGGSGGRQIAALSDRDRPSSGNKHQSVPSAYRGGGGGRYR
mmetsp:Transcript_107847/g.168477  ORF Transcript_107847/g.168477 Transcript_107847/m.168477 type:complete len:269 (-) Transcript_107847:76-882(-)